jgi:hypothetical protein
VRCVADCRQQLSVLEFYPKPGQAKTVLIDVTRRASGSVIQSTSTEQAWKFREVI